ncbi:MAG: ATP-binding cassette domain-containing protein [bacterium]|nr:ATP-binding cassette domain-containing protein [bacterium]
MSLLRIRDISIAFGGPVLLDGINFQVDRGERVCLLGRNGSGKSTLMKLINGDSSPDSGEIVTEPGVRIALLSQDIPANMGGSIFDLVCSGLGEKGELLSRYHHLSKQVKDDSSSELLKEMDTVHHALDENNAWDINRQAEKVISKMELNPDAEFDSLSVGLKRRAALARALVGDPDILLLDEPTNHLDLDAIAWLEEFLLRYEGTLFFVTHDRAFLRKLATRIIELDRGNLTNWACNYDTYLQRKQDLLNAEDSQNALFDKKLAVEEAWIRQGIKARRTRNEGRVRALEKMREERWNRRDQTGSVRLQVNEAERTGKLVIEAERVDFAYDKNEENRVIRDFSTLIMRGDKVGIMGPNGSGKTTLIRVLLGQLKPVTGTVRLGARLEPAYFDQVRAQLDEETSVQDNVLNGAETIMVNNRKRHVIGYLEDFLFPPSRARSPVKALSGGERNRLLLAQMFARPSNLLILDEPTNDLDTDTLELLEELLIDYPGTILIVSHDRAFLNNVVTSTLAFEGDGIVREYVGGYDDWVRQRLTDKTEIIAEKVLSKEKKERIKTEAPRKLSFNERKELEELPGRLESLEAEKDELFNSMSDPDFYRQESDKIAAAKERLEAVEGELAHAYERWEELDEVAAQEK